ncbi:hypothetical protein MMC17_009659 [Xylographa soralifera]|nr:hypothetical protein [Xylographa soralifera]
MSNSVLPCARESAAKPATELRVVNRNLSAIGVGADLGFSSARSPKALFEVPSSGVALPSRPFSPTAPEFIPGAVYASRQGLNTTMNQVNAPVVSNSGLKLHGPPPSTEHGQEVLQDAQDRAWQVFHRTDSVAYDVAASPEYLSGSADNLSRPYPYYPASKVSNASYGTRPLVPSPTHVTAAGRITGHEQYARLGIHRSTSQNKPDSGLPGPFDERWVDSPEEMWNTDTTRTSPLTISPGESGTDNEGGNASSGSFSGRSSVTNTVIHPSSTIVHTNPSESLSSWLDAVGPNAEARTSLDWKQTPAHSLSEGYGMKGTKVSMARNEQHQARKNSGKFAHDILSGVSYPTSEQSNHGREHTSHARADFASIEGSSETMSSIPQYASEGAIARLTKKSMDRSKHPLRIPMPHYQRQQGSTGSFLTSKDKILEMAKGRATDAAIALEELDQKYELCDQVESGSGRRGDTTWMSSLTEKVKRRRATSEAFKVKEEIRLDEKIDRGLCASVLGKDLPSVVVTSNMNSPQMHGKLVLFDGTGATAHDTSAFETSGAGHIMGQSLLARKENQSQHDSYPEVNETTEHTGAFSSQLSATMNMANLGEQEERVKTLRILQRKLSADITIQDTYGQQQRSQRLRAASGEQLYYEMTDGNGRPHILPWPPEEGSPAYTARHKPEQLLRLEAHPKGFFISHPIEQSEETVCAHYLRRSTGLGNINPRGNSYQAHSQFGNTRSGKQIRGERFFSTQNEMQRLDSIPRNFEQLVTSRFRSRSPGITQNSQQEVGPLQIKEIGDVCLETSDAMNYEQQPGRGFVPTTNGPLVVFEDGLPSTEIPDLNPMASACASQSAGRASVSAPTLAGPSALAMPNSNGPGCSNSIPGSYRSNHRPAMLHYRPGVDTMFPVPMARPSLRYRRLTCFGQPNYEFATKDEFQPFFEAARLRKPAFWGVMKFTGIPYAVSKQDILAFLGRNAKILTPNYGEPIHIIMERATGKTMDAYVEFFSHADAQAAVNKFMRGRMEQDRSFRMMDRHIKVELSSQEALMRDLFPKAKNVRWNGQIPIIVPSDDPFNSGFKCFLSGEELHTLTKLVDSSNGPMFCRQCPSRPYENMISTLHKFPWFAVQLYTLFQRDQLFNAILKMLRTLMATVSPTSSFGLTSDLLTDLLYAGLNAPGFSEKQKWDLCQVADWAAKTVAISPLTKGWPWLVLARKPDWDDDVIMYYAQILNAHNQKRIGPITANDSFFGDMLTSQLRISVNVSLEAAAQTEFQHFKDLVKLVLDNHTVKHGGTTSKRAVTNNLSTTNNLATTRSRTHIHNGPTTNNALVMHHGLRASYCAGQDYFAATNNYTATNSHAEAINPQALSSPAVASNFPVTSSFHPTSHFSGTKNSLATSNLPAMSKFLATSTFPCASYPTGTGKLPTITESLATGIPATTSHHPTANYPVGTGSSLATNNFPVPNNYLGQSNSLTPSYLPGTSNHKSRGSFFMPSKSPTTSTFLGTGIFAMTSNLPGMHSRLPSISPADMGNFPAIGTAAPPRFISDVESSVVPKNRWQ